MKRYCDGERLHVPYMCVRKEGDDKEWSYCYRNDDNDASKIVAVKYKPLLVSSDFGYYNGNKSLQELHVINFANKETVDQIKEIEIERVKKDLFEADTESSVESIRVNAENNAKYIKEMHSSAIKIKKHSKSIFITNSVEASDQMKQKAEKQIEKMFSKIK